MTTLMRFGTRPPVGGGPVFVGSGGISSTSSTSINLDYPSGRQVGDLMIAIITDSSAPLPGAAPSGWTHVMDGYHLGPDHAVGIFTHTATSAGAGTETFATYGSTQMGIILGFRGHSGTDIPTTSIPGPLYNAIGQGSRDTGAWPGPNGDEAERSNNWGNAAGDILVGVGLAEDQLSTAAGFSDPTGTADHVFEDHFGDALGLIVTVTENASANQSARNLRNLGLGNWQTGFTCGITVEA